MDVVISVYNLKKCSNNCSKPTGDSRKYLREEINDTLKSSESFKSKLILKSKFKLKITTRTPFW